MKESTRKLLDGHGLRNLPRFVDGYLYLGFIHEYIRVISLAFKGIQTFTGERALSVLEPLISLMTHRYHGKVLAKEDAEKILTLEKDIEVPQSLADTIIPFEKANRIVFRNPESIVAIKCSCREVTGHDCEPAHRCLIIGEPFTSFVLEHARNVHPKRLTQKEALELLSTCHQKGFVHTAFFKNGALNQNYAICNCDPECCISIGVHKFLGQKQSHCDCIAHSGRQAEIQSEHCAGHGRCVQACPFGAIRLEKSIAVVNQNVCLGCGTCVDVCPTHALQLKPTPLKGVPLDIDILSQEKKL